MKSRSGKGLIYIFTGEGKGKTSAALGVALRSLCIDKKVAWISWYKQSSWPISELNWSKFMPIEFYLLGKGFMLPKNQSKLALKTGGQVVDKADHSEHLQAAKQALEKAQQLLKTQKYDLLVLDEINNAIFDNLLNINQILDLLKLRKHTHLILTGRNADKQIVSKADLVSEVKNIKHPFDKGLSAVRGLDF